MNWSTVVLRYFFRQYKSMSTCCYQYMYDASMFDAEPSSFREELKMDFYIWQKKLGDFRSWLRPAVLVAYTLYTPTTHAGCKWIVESQILVDVNYTFPSSTPVKMLDTQDYFFNGLNLPTFALLQTLENVDITDLQLHFSMISCVTWVPNDAHMSNISYALSCFLCTFCVSTRQSGEKSMSIVCSFNSCH